MKREIRQPRGTMGNTSSSSIQKKITNVKRYKMLKEKKKIRELSFRLGLILFSAELLSTVLFDVSCERQHLSSTEELPGRCRVQTIPSCLVPVSPGKSLWGLILGSEHAHAQSLSSLSPSYFSFLPGKKQLFCSLN